MPTLRSPVSLALLLCALVLPGRASADPRWWWSDLRLTDTSAASITPHVIAPGYVSGGSGGNQIFVTWSELDPLDGDLEIWAKASFDAGCTWCAATRLTNNAVDDTLPRIAVLALPTGFYSFAVAYESAEQVVIAWDSTTVSFQVPFDQACTEFEALGAAIIANDQYVRFGVPGSRADHPDIVQASTFAFGHFHATWRDTRNGVSSIYHAHDLTARGGLGWLLDPEKELTPAGPLTDGDNYAPVIAADFMTDPDPASGMVTNDRTAPTVAYVHVAPTDEVSIHVLRSVDSGRTFSPSGERIDRPGAPISDTIPPGDAFAEPAIDATAGFSTQDPAWVAVAFEDTRGIEGPDVACDARFHDTPATALPDFQDPDERVTETVTRGGGADGPSLALQRSFGQPVPAWVAWEDPRFGTPDIAIRAGILDRMALDVIDFTRYPIPAVRPLDPGASEEVQLTHCAFDETTFGCTPTRTAGVATTVELSGNEQFAVAVWSDTRDGNAEIYFKRTDRSVSMNAATLDTECGPLGDAVIHVTFPPVDSCPVQFAGERMLRYLVYVGTDPGGPFDNAANPLVVAHDPGLGASVTVTLTGLPTGVLHHVIVVPEDEARNVHPDTFDPTVDQANAWVNERSIVTASPCAAPEICLYRFDVTGLQPHDPARPLVYVAPRTPEDIALQGLPYACPFADNDLEPDLLAATNGVALVLYQVNRPVTTLRVARETNRLRFRF